MRWRDKKTASHVLFQFLNICLNVVKGVRVDCHRNSIIFVNQKQISWFTDWKWWLNKCLTNFFFLFFISSSLSVVSNNGYRLFAFANVNQVDELFCNNDDDTKIAERLFCSSLVAVVTKSDPNKLKVKLGSWLTFFFLILTFCIFPGLSLQEINGNM